MVRANDSTFWFVMDIVDNVIAREYKDIYAIGEAHMITLDNMRMELWLGFLQQYVLKITPKTGLLILEIV